jgi:hypothetical protein
MWKHSKCPSINERIDKMWYFHTMEFWCTIKRNKLTMHGSSSKTKTLWKVQEVKKNSTYIIISLYLKCQVKESLHIKKCIYVFLGLGLERDMTYNEYEETHWEMKTS